MSNIKTVNTAEIAGIVDSLINNPNIKISKEYKISYYPDSKSAIERIFYFFDKPNSKHEFPEQFEILNHDARLVRYDTPRGEMWFFADGKNTSGFFVKMDAQSKQIFDKVKIALINQHIRAR